MTTTSTTSRAMVVLTIALILAFATYQHPTSSDMEAGDPFHIKQQSSQSRLVKEIQNTSQRKPIPEDSEPDRITALTEKLSTPREFSVEETGSKPTAYRRQFLHLHHMKTGRFLACFRRWCIVARSGAHRDLPAYFFFVRVSGGTSMDQYLQCAVSRLERDKKMSIPYATIHECSMSTYERCRSGADNRCTERLANAAVMSYCAPLKDLPYFSWGSLESGAEVTPTPSQGAITVLRHPVDRVWSMVRTGLSLFWCFLLLVPSTNLSKLCTVSIPNKEMLPMHAPKEYL